MIPDDIAAASEALSEAVHRRWAAEESEALVCLRVIAALVSRDRVRLACRGHEAAPQISAEEVYRKADDFAAVQNHDVGAEFSWRWRVKKAREAL